MRQEPTYQVTYQLYPQIWLPRVKRLTSHITDSMGTPQGPLEPRTEGKLWAICAAAGPWTEPSRSRWIMAGPSATHRIQVLPKAGASSPSSLQSARSCPAGEARSRGRTAGKRSKGPDRLPAVRPLTCNYLVAGAGLKPRSGRSLGERLTVAAHPTRSGSATRCSASSSAPLRTASEDRPSAAGISMAATAATATPAAPAHSAGVSPATNDAADP